jgi:hypothetical protein
MDRASKGGEYRDQFSSGQSRTHERFARSVLDGLSAHIAVLNGAGVIVAVNEAWREFARTNGADPGKVSEGSSYLEVCGAATGPSSEGPPRSRRGCGTCCAAGRGPSSWSTRATLASRGAGSSGV